MRANVVAITFVTEARSKTVDGRHLHRLRRRGETVRSPVSNRTVARDQKHGAGNAALVDPEGDQGVGRGEPRLRGLRRSPARMPTMYRMSRRTTITRRPALPSELWPIGSASRAR